MNYKYLVNKKEVSAFNESLRGTVKSVFFFKVGSIVWIIPWSFWRAMVGDSRARDKSKEILHAKCRWDGCCVA